MFTGIVEEKGLIASLKKGKLILHSTESLMRDLKRGASVSVEGVCLTVTEIQNNFIVFDLLDETLSKTTLGSLTEGSYVNIERALKMGQEIGGHLLSGHVVCKGEVAKWERNVLTVTIPPSLSKYLFPKGYIAIDGMSLTLVEVNQNSFTVHLIPETLAQTTIGSKKVGSFVNIEVDMQTLSIVDTVERILSTKREANG